MSDLTVRLRKAAEYFDAVGGNGTAALLRESADDLAASRALLDQTRAFVAKPFGQLSERAFYRLREALTGEATDDA